MCAKVPFHIGVEIEESESLRFRARLGGMMDSSLIELDRTASNLIELVHPKKHGNDRQNAINYEEQSKSVELDRTVTPNFLES